MNITSIRILTSKRITHSKRQHKSKYTTHKLEKLINPRFVQAKIIYTLSILTILSQLVSRNWLWGDSAAGQAFEVLPSNRDIHHLDQQIDYVFPEPISKSAKDQDYLIVFGVNISQNNALLGAQILANEVNNPVTVIHNGSVNIVIDYLRAALGRLHFAPWGRGN